MYYITAGIIAKSNWLERNSLQLFGCIGDYVDAFTAKLVVMIFKRNNLLQFLLILNYNKKDF